MYENKNGGAAERATPFNPDLEPVALAQELCDGLHDNRTAQALAFLRDCPLRTLHSLSHLDGDSAGWVRDHALWLDLARVTIPRGVLFRCSNEVPARSATLSDELRRLAAAYLDGASAVEHAPLQSHGFVIAHVLPLLWYEGLPEHQAAELIRWALDLRRAAGLAPHSQYNTGWHRLITAIQDVEILIELAETGGQLREAILWAYGQHRRHDRDRSPWTPWHPFFLRHPDLYTTYPVTDDAELISLCWPQATAEQKAVLADKLLSALQYSKRSKAGLDILDRLVVEAPELFAEALKRRARYYLTPQLAQHIWKRQHGPLLPLLLPGIADVSEPKEFRQLLNQLLTARPDDVETVDVVKLAALVPLLEPEVVRALWPRLGKLASTTTSKVFRAALAKAGSQLGPSELPKAGWLTSPNKNLKLVCRDVLLAHPSPDALPLLSRNCLLRRTVPRTAARNALGRRCRHAGGPCHGRGLLALRPVERRGRLRCLVSDHARLACRHRAAVSGGRMNDPLNDWLDEWGAWPGALLTTGLACPTAHIHRQIEGWCVDAETLGDRDNSAKARALSSPGLPLQQRTQLLLDLLLEQDMSVRLLQLERLAFHHRSLEN